MKLKVTRTGYCTACYQEERPKTGNVYAVHGSTGYHIEVVEYAVPHYNPAGFVPHIFEIDKSADGYVYGTKTCCMDGCGFDIRNNPDYEHNSSAAPYLISVIKKSPFKMKISDWNALILTKNLGYRLE